MSNNSVDKMALIRELGTMLEDIVRGSEDEYSDIYLNYLDKLNKITKIFMVNIKKEIAVKKEQDDNSDNEELIKKYLNDMGDVDSVSEYEDNISDTELEDNKEKPNKNPDDVKKSLVDFDNVIEQLYNHMINNNVFIYKQI